MGEQKTKVENRRETLPNRVKKIESTLLLLESQLRQKESQSESIVDRIKKLEQKLSRQIADFQNQIKAAAMPASSDCITLEKGHAVDLEELENKMEERHTVLAARERELEDLQKRISTEVENVLAKNKENDLLLAAWKMEFKNLKQTMKIQIEDLGGVVKNQRVGKNKANRLVSFLTDIGRKSN